MARHHPTRNHRVLRPRLITNHFQVTHYGGCAVLLNKRYLLRHKVAPCRAFKWHTHVSRHSWKRRRIWRRCLIHDEDQGGCSDSVLIGGSILSSFNTPSGVRFTVFSCHGEVLLRFTADFALRCLPYISSHLGKKRGQWAATLLFSCVIVLSYVSTSCLFNILIFSMYFEAMSVIFLLSIRLEKPSIMSKIG